MHPFLKSNTYVTIIPRYRFELVAQPNKFCLKWHRFRVRFFGRIQGLIFDLRS